MSDCYFVYITVKNMAEAKKTGNLLVRKKLAACVNIFQGMQSIYFWEGKIQNDEEAVVIMKTQKRKLKELEKTVRENHSYKNPCIVWFKVDGGSKMYRDWIQNSIE